MQVIYYNGRILTMRKAKPVFVEAVLAEDGKLEQVGDEADIFWLAENNAEKVNLYGRTFLLSFIEPQGSINLVVGEVDRVDVSRCHSIEGLLQVLEDYIKENSKKEMVWIEGYGGGCKLFTEKGRDIKNVLDQVSRDTVIFITNLYGEVKGVNTCGLEYLLP